MEDYKEVRIKKRSGGYRKIEIPNKKLKKKQKKLLKEFYKDERLKPSIFAHGFRKYRNIVTASIPHVGKKYLVKIDIKDFFNSVTLKKFLIEKKDVNCDEVLKEKVMKCFKSNEKGKMYLPQGSPTSPFLSNAFLKNFDYKIGFFSAKPTAFSKNWFDYVVRYTRYADDIFLSSDKKWWLKKTINYINNLLDYLNLEEKKEKRKWMINNGQRQSVCNITVNEKLNLHKNLRNKIRAIKHNKEMGKEIDKEGEGLLALENMIKKDYSDYNITDNIEVFNNHLLIKEL